MNKRVLILSTSPRPQGNSDLLAAEFARGAREAGHFVEKIDLWDKAIGFCRGCLACQQTGCCAIRDDADAIVQKMGAADVLVFATPIYFYEMCGQMKTLLDRANPLFATDCAFRAVYLLTAAADAGERAADGAIKGLQGWVSCFDRARLQGVVRGTGATARGDIRRAPEILGRAYAMGRGV